MIILAKRIESPSSINTFKQCPRKYFYQYIQELPVLSNIHQVRGSIAHSTLEKFYDLDVTQFKEEDYANQFQSAIQKLFLNSAPKPGITEVKQKSSCKISSIVRL